MATWRALAQSNSRGGNFLAVAVIAACLLILILAIRYFTPDVRTDQSKRNEIAHCVESTLAILKPTSLDNALLRDTVNTCYHRDYQNLLLTDFQIRRTKFAQQAYDERVLLWMVVAITISGVCLAALQLLISYKLASKGKSLGDTAEQSTLEIERSKISLKSSVTGLMILIISFAFFLVFVLEIFRLTELNVAGQPTAQVGTTPNLRVTPIGNFQDSQLQNSNDARIGSTPDARALTPTYPTK